MKKCIQLLAICFAFVFYGCETEECKKCYEIQKKSDFNEQTIEVGTKCGCEIHEFEDQKILTGGEVKRRYCK